MQFMNNLSKKKKTNNNRWKKCIILLTIMDILHIIITERNTEILMKMPIIFRIDTTICKMACSIGLHIYHLSIRILGFPEITRIGKIQDKRWKEIITILITTPINTRCIIRIPMDTMILIFIILAKEKRNEDYNLKWLLYKHIK